jgi:hypothetical protein
VSSKERDNEQETRRSLHLEDVMILVCIGLLFWLGVFRRREPEAQLLLGAVFIVMLVVFIRRVRRTYRAFKDRGEEQ